MGQSERYRKQNRITRKTRGDVLSKVLCAIAFLVLLAFLWTTPTEDSSLQTSLAEDFSQSETPSIENQAASTDTKVTVINSSNSEINTPGVNGVKDTKEKSSKKKTKKTESSKSSSTKDTKDKESGQSSNVGTNGSKKGSGGSLSVSGNPESNGTEAFKANASSNDGGTSAVTSISSDASSGGTGPSEADDGSTSSASPGESAAKNESQGSAAPVSGTSNADVSGNTASEEANDNPSPTAAETTHEEGEDAAITDEHDIFDYSGWGYSSYAKYVEHHPIKARITYVRLWFLRLLNTAQPAGCSGCSRIEEAIPEREEDVPRPKSGQIFENSGQGSIPQLVVVAPDAQDAFVKLKNSEGDVLLSFYVRSGTTVKACVPASECYFYYTLGTDWKGEEELFGSDAVYAKSDRSLNFKTPMNTYQYRFGVENGNVTPKKISRTAF